MAQPYVKLTEKGGFRIFTVHASVGKATRRVGRVVLGKRGDPADRAKMEKVILDARKAWSPPGRLRDANS